VPSNPIRFESFSRGQPPLGDALKLAGGEGAFFCARRVVTVIVEPVLVVAAAAIRARIIRALYNSYGHSRRIFLERRVRRKPISRSR